MYEPGRSKYAFVGLTEQIDRILNTKQDDGENLVDYTKRFKQVRDNAKGSLGEKFLESFIKNTKEYKDKETLGDSKECKQMVKTSTGAWMAFLLLRNADSWKYRSLKRGFQTQHSLGNNQYPKTVTKMFEVLQSHQWDATYGAHVKKKKNERKEAKNQNNESDTSPQGTSLAQKVVCFCCGEEGHKLNACTKKIVFQKVNGQSRRA